MALLALCAGGLTGCPKPMTLRPYPAPVAAELLGFVRHGHDSVLALRARAKADYLDGSAGRVKIDIGLALARPNRLRLSGENALTGPLLTLATDGNSFQLLDVRQNTFMAGKVSPCNMARLIRVALHPREAVEVLLGGVPLLGDGDVTESSVDWSGKDGGREVLTLRDARGWTEVLWLAARPASGAAPGAVPSGWEVREAEGREASGQVVWRVRHEDFTDVPLTDESASAGKAGGESKARTVRLPATTYIEDPPHKSDVRLRWRERELNPNLEPGVFHLDAPPGIPTEPDLCAGATPGAPELPPGAPATGTPARHPMTPAATPPSGPPLPDWDELERRIARRARRRVKLPSFRESAVLALIVDVQVPSAGLPADAAPPEPELLFIVRNASLPTHAGQIAFPGGKREPSDATLIDTALRETTEEVGIAAASIRVLGALDDVATPMGFVVTPVVGVLRGPLALKVHEGEVAATFTTALRRLPATYRCAGEADWQGYRYTMHEFLYDEYRIWGATAAITLQLLDTLALLSAPPRDPQAIR